MSVIGLNRNVSKDSINLMDSKNMRSPESGRITDNEPQRNRSAKDHISIRGEKDYC